MSVHTKANRASQPIVLDIITLLYVLQ